MADRELGSMARLDLMRSVPLGFAKLEGNLPALGAVSLTAEQRVLWGMGEEKE